MAKGHRSQIKRARNENNRETRPSAKLSYARISVQKACYVLDAIRGKDVQTALGILTYNPRYASSVIKKLLESAIANAENNNGMNADNLVVAACYANKGPTMKRIQPRAQGRAYKMCIRDRNLEQYGCSSGEDCFHGRYCSGKWFCRSKLFFRDFPKRDGLFSCRLSEMVPWPVR